ncbi:hypothetical protein N7G274_005569 [Stereocaulon virgatum]|uniref:Uncharacterized protein n=1 Tax=Stereocaulon virgatum TaxID=373712 RepID=A0ABR4A8H1_9LECA
MPCQYFVVLLITLHAILFNRCLGQIRDCYDWAGQITPALPCDPATQVSACCNEGSVCVTNLYCISPLGANVVGGCTDRSWNDPACPFRLDAAHLVPNFDHFSYARNTTQCNDGTICPFPNNQTCCDNKQGITEITYHNLRALPSSPRNLAAALSTYYEGGAYSTVGPPTSASSTTLSLSVTSAVSSTSTSPESITSSPPPPASSSSSGLGVGSKAAIGVGGAVAIGTLGATLVYLLRRHRQGSSFRKRHEMPAGATVVDYKTVAQALPPMQIRRSELDSAYMSGTPENRQELPVEGNPLR